MPARQRQDSSSSSTGERRFHLYHPEASAIRSMIWLLLLVEQINVVQSGERSALMVGRYAGLATFGGWGEMEGTVGQQAWSAVRPEFSDEP